MSRKKIVSLVLVAAIIIGGGYLVYARRANRATVETAAVFQEIMVTAQNVTERLLTTGTVRSNETWTITARVSGEVIELSVDIGDEVKEGDVLVSIDDASIRLAILEQKNRLNTSINQVATLKNQKNNLAAGNDTNLLSLSNNMNNAEIMFQNAAEIYENNVHLYDTGAISKSELESSLDKKNKLYNDYLWTKARHDTEYAATSDDFSELESNIKLAQESVEIARARLNDLYADLKDTEITSPLSGTVTALMIKEGDYLSPNMKVLEIKDLASLEIETNISEYEIDQIVLEQEVLITLMGNREKVYSGTVAKIFPTAEIAGDEVTIPIIVEVLDEDRNLLPNLTTSLEIIIASKENALVIPYEALIRLPGGRHAIMIAGEADEKKILPVETGVRGDLFVEIKGDDIHEGMKVFIEMEAGAAEEIRPGFMRPPGGGSSGGGIRPGQEV